MKKKYRFGVVILNYMSYKETLECMEKFQETDCTNVDVEYVIVENGSPNESYEVLKEKFQNMKNVHLIKIDNNLGFAKGNNAGLDFLKENFDCDFFIFSNNDILVPKNIFNWIIQTYEENECDILGPDIYALKLSKHQNPIKEYTTNRYLVYFKILIKKIEIFLLYLRVIKKKPSKKNKLYNLKKEDVKIYNKPVHGSFIVSNSKFLDFYDSFFDNRTFLYMEEYLLFIKLRKCNLKFLVSLDNTVIHLQGSSTDLSEVDYRKKRINKLRRDIDSLKIYALALKEYKRGARDDDNQSNKI